MTSSTRDRTHPNLTLAVLALGGMAYALLSSAVVPALPTMQHDLGTSETGITWLLTGYLLAASVGTSILGRLGDMYDKERLLLWTLILLGASVVVSGLYLLPATIGMTTSACAPARSRPASARATRCWPGRSSPPPRSPCSPSPTNTPTS